MIQKRNRKHKHAVALADFANGCDENNLAEFPIAFLSDTAPPNQKTLEFQDTIRDWKTGKEVTRRVCITGSDKFGLPTAKDDQVLAALIQLTGIVNNFTNPEVPFSKHQIIELLRWEDSGWAYDRVEESLHRWKGVSVHYWNAWRDHESGSWTDSEAVGVIDYVKISDGRRHQKIDSRHAQSRFVWNRQYFKSFEAKYMKPLDFRFFCSLKRPAAQRAYRFLDKRFFHQPVWEFDLHTLACEKLGFSRNYDTGQLKARLHPAMEELEKAGFIKPVSYRKIRPKVWNVLVSKETATRSASRDLPVPSSPMLVEQLVEKGVARSTADSLVEEFSKGRVEEKLRYVDWLIARNDKRTPVSTAGFLVAAIRNDYPLPKDFLKYQSKKTIKTRNPTTAQAGTHQPSVSPELNAYLAALTPEQHAELEAAALEAADHLTADGYRRSKESGGPAFVAYRQMVIEKHVGELLAALSKPESQA